jgi:hypothetical protein
MTNPEDLTEIERAGRRCAVCHSGRKWRRLEVIRADGRETVVLCASCRARSEAEKPAGRETAPVPEPSAAVAKATPRPKQRARTAQRPTTAQRQAPQGQAAQGTAAQGTAAEGPAAPGPAAQRQAASRPDRLRAALPQLPSSFSTAMAARAAGLNNEKTIARLQDMERRGEVRRDGNRWTTEAAPTDLTAAIDRLEARTSNLRIIRDRTPVA